MCMHQRILSLGIRLRVLIVTVGGLLMLSGPAKTERISQNYIKRRVDKSLNQEFSQTIGLLGAPTPAQGSLALVGLGAVLVALGFKRRRS